MRWATWAPLANLALTGCAALAPGELYTEVGRTDYAGAVDVFDSWDARVGVTWQLGPWQRQIGEIAAAAAASQRQLERLVDRPAIPAVEVHAGEAGGAGTEAEDGGAPMELLLGGGAALLTAAGAALRIRARRRRAREDAECPEATTEPTDG